MAEYLGRLRIWRVSWRWWAVVVLGIPVVYLSAAVIAALAGAPTLRRPPAFWAPLWVSALLAATAGPVEELGWRGFALPLLQRRCGAAAAALSVGVIWAVWHLPAFVVGRVYADGFGLPLPEALFWFTIQLLAFSVVLAVVYNATGGSLLLVMIGHWTGNLAYPWEGPADAFAAQAILLAMFAALVGLAVRGDPAQRENRVRHVLPGDGPGGARRSPP